MASMEPPHHHPPALGALPPAAPYDPMLAAAASTAAPAAAASTVAAAGSGMNIPSSSASTKGVSVSLPDAAQAGDMGMSGSGGGNKRPRLDDNDSEAFGEAVCNASSSPLQVSGEGAGAGGEAGLAAAEVEVEALLREVKELKRKESERKATEAQLLEQLAKERREKEQMKDARGGLQGAVYDALRGLEDVKGKLKASEGQRKALALAAAELQQAVGAASPEAVLPALRALQALRAGQGKLKGEREKAEAEAMAARAALAKEMDKTREANRRASAAEKAKKELEDKIREQKRALEGAEADKAKALKEAEASYQQAAQLAAAQAARQLTNATAVTLQAQLQAAQQAAQQAKEGQAKAEAEAAKHKGDLQRVREVSETQMNLRMRSEEKAEKAQEDAAEAARQVAEAGQRAGEAEARVRRLEDELRRVQTQGQNDVSRTQFLETESARLRQEVEALRGQAAEDGKEKKRLDEGWTRESAHRRRAQSERDAARDKEREGRAGWAAAEHARTQAVEERDAALAELQTFKANYDQFVDWVRMLCRLAGLAAEDTDGLGEWVQAARKRQLQRQQQEHGEASSAVSVKTEGGSSKSGKARAYEEEDEVGLNALTMKYREAQRELNGAKDLLIELSERAPDAVPARWFGQVSSEEVQTALIEDSWTTKKGGLEKVMTKIEKELRNVQWDPFLRRGGEIEGVNEEDDEVKAFRKAYGQQTTALILEKKRELEEHNSSGGYPTKLLSTPDGQVLSLPEALTAVITKAFPPRPDDAAGGGAEGSGGGGGGGQARAQSTSSSRRRR